MPTASSDRVFDALHALMHMYRARCHRVLRDSPHDLTHMETKVLGFFARHPGATLSDLVAESGRDKAQLTRLIRGLRERDLLAAQADTHDRRSSQLRLTEAGAALHGQMRQYGRELSAQAMQGLSEADCAQLLALLQKIRTNLDTDDA